MRDDDHDGGREAAQERRAEEREDDLRQAGRFPHNVHFVRPEVPLVLSKQAREQIVAAADRGLAISTLPAALPAGPVLGTAHGKISISPDFNVPMVLDTDENGEPRGRVAVDDAPATTSWRDFPMLRTEPLGPTTDDDCASSGDTAVCPCRTCVAYRKGRQRVSRADASYGPAGKCIRCPGAALVEGSFCASCVADGEWRDDTSFSDPERCPPDPDDEAVIRHATATVERPAPLLPAAELFFAAACKATSAVRSDTTTTAGLEAAHRAARLAADLARRLEEGIAAARDLRARQWPKVCVCSAQYTREQYRALKSHGVQRDDAGDLDLRACPSCGSTIAMPVGQV